MPRRFLPNLVGLGIDAGAQQQQRHLLGIQQQRHLLGIQMVQPTTLLVHATVVVVGNLRIVTVTMGA